MTSQQQASDHATLKAAALGSIFVDAAYPVQTDTPRDPEWGGELRGFYPNFADGSSQPIRLGHWFPPNSIYRKSAERGRRRHGGLDIYVAFFPYPDEVPVVALLPGRVAFRTAVEAPDGLGNRIWLTIENPDVSGTYQLIYGHLSRFVGDDRRVEKGEIVGYAGMSGNANTVGESTTLVSPCGVSSGHVHVQFRRIAPGATTPIDPQRLMGGTLKYDDDMPENRLTCAQWTEPNKYETQPRPAERPGVIAAGAIGPLARRRRGHTYVRQRPAAPFNWLDFDDSRSLRQTRDAYREIAARLAVRVKADGGGATVPASFAVDGVTRLRALTDPGTPGQHNTSAWDLTVAGLLDRARDAIEGWTAVQPAQGNHVLKALLLCNEALFILMGGDALEAVATNHKALATGPPPVGRHRNRGRLPACGIGIQGTVWATEFDGALSALHDTAHELVPEAGAPPPPEPIRGPKALSMTFGTGSLRHATLSAISLSKTTNAAARTLIKDVAKELYSQRVTLRLVHRYHVRLSQGNTNTGNAIKEIFIAKFERLKALADRIHTLPATDDTPDPLQAYLTAIAQGNEDHFGQALAASRADEPDQKKKLKFALGQRACPLINTLTLQEPPAT